ncbi:MAG: ABC transporter substrate-binding protein, partial [Synergistaceae bacterium]|nr:ABC transporter substrate-binding protein [Synergistaceae bacterium]
MKREMPAPKFKKSLLMFSVFLITAVLTAPIGNVAEAADVIKTVVFANWVSVEEATQSRIVEIIKAFESANPDIRIEIQGIPVSDIVKEITIRSTAGDPPDIAQIPSDNVLQLQSAGLLSPLDDLLGEDFQRNIYKDLYDATGLVDGVHYAVPWANSTHGLFYNRKLLAQAGLDPARPPKTIGELADILKIARERLTEDVILIQADTTVRTLGLLHQWPFLLAFNGGVEPYNLKGEVNFNTDGIKKYMEWLRLLIKEKYTLPGLKYGEFRPYAAQDKLLFGNDWTCFDGILRSLNKDITPDYLYETWGATALPADANGKHRTPVQAHTLVLFKNSGVNKEAAKFLEFLVSDKIAIEQYIAANGFTPVTLDAFEKAPSLSKSAFIKSFISDVVPTSVTLPTGPDYAS